MWDQRFSEPGFAYGTEPNDFLRSVVGRLPQAPTLCIGEGEGRNAVFLAQQGLEVTAVDASAVGLAKARDLARQHGVTIRTVHADLADYKLGSERWGAIVEIFCHLPQPLRGQVHSGVVSALAPGGVFVLESYTPAQLEYRTGGPPALERLYDRESVTEVLSSLELVHVCELVREVREGRYHHGPGAVLQVLAVKPS